MAVMWGKIYIEGSIDENLKNLCQFFLFLPTQYETVFGNLRFSCSYNSRLVIVLNQSLDIFQNDLKRKK